MDIYFNAMKIKFDTLKDLTQNLFDNNHIQTANFFINLDDLNSRFRNVKSNQEFQCCGGGAFKQYTSNVLNLAAHYRQWLHRCGIKSKIFIYHTTASGGFVSSSMIPEYRSQWVSKTNLNNPDCYYVNITIDSAINLMKDIVDYIDGVYLIDSKCEDPISVPYLISEHFPADWNFILTKDRVELQYSIFDKFSILYPSSRYGARLINSSNLWSFIAEKECIDSLHVNQLDPKLYILCLGILGNGYRSVPKIKKISWRTIFEFLDSIYEKSMDHSTVTIVDEFNEMLSKKGESVLDQVVRSELVLSMRAVFESMSEVDKQYILMQMNDIPDIESLQQINRDPMILGNYPINLAFLTEQAVSFGQKKNPWA